MQYTIFLKEYINDSKEISMRYLDGEFISEAIVNKIKIGNDELLDNIGIVAEAEKFQISNFDNVMMIKVPIFSDNTNVGELETYMNEIGENKTIIIDLRMTSGGKVDVAKEFASLFINHESELFYETERKNDGLYQLKKVSIAPKLCKKCRDIFVIQNEYTASAAEYIVINALIKNNARTIGTKTAGFSNQASVFFFEDNTKLELTSKLYVNSDGTAFMPLGFEPTFYYPMPLQITDKEIVDIVKCYYTS